MDRLAQSRPADVILKTLNLAPQPACFQWLLIPARPVLDSNDFPKELWMNWVKYYGRHYYGTALLRDFVADMKRIDPDKVTAATVVFKKDQDGLMPPLTASDLESAMTDFLQTTQVDILMPQDGIGAMAGAAPITELPAYFAAMANAHNKAGVGTVLLAIIETFTAAPNLSGDRYPPASISRVAEELNAVRPYVSGSGSWIFGHACRPRQRTIRRKPPRYIGNIVLGMRGLLPVPAQKRADDGNPTSGSVMNPCREPTRRGITNAKRLRGIWSGAHPIQACGASVEYKPVFSTA